MPTNHNEQSSDKDAKGASWRNLQDFWAEYDCIPTLGFAFEKGWDDALAHARLEGQLCQECFARGTISESYESRDKVPEKLKWYCYLHHPRLRPKEDPDAGE